MRWRRKNEQRDGRKGGREGVEERVEDGGVSVVSSRWKRIASGRKEEEEKREACIYIYIRFVFFSNSSVPRTRGHRERGAQSREEKWKEVEERWRVAGRAEHRVEYGNGKEG